MKKDKRFKINKKTTQEKQNIKRIRWSDDIKEKVNKLAIKGYRRDEIKELLDVPSGTTARWVAENRKKIKGTYIPKESKKRGRALKVDHPFLKDLALKYTKTSLIQLNRLYNQAKETNLAINTTSSAYKRLELKKVVGNKRLRKINEKAAKESEEQLKEKIKNFKGTIVAIDEMRIDTEQIDSTKITVEKTDKERKNTQIGKLSMQINHEGAVDLRTGDTYSLIIPNGTINAQIFIILMTVIVKQIREKKENPFEPILLVADNVPFHKTAAVIGAMKKINVEFFFIAPCSPHLNLQENVNFSIKKGLSNLFAIKYDELISNINNSSEIIVETVVDFLHEFNKKKFFKIPKCSIISD